jgi:hypothetical protein
MGRKLANGLDRWTTALGMLLVVSALLACKKKKAEAEATPSAAPVATVEPPKVEQPKADEVKRYGAEEVAETGSVRVKGTAKVFREADTGSEAMISLASGTLVNRKARMGGFTLIEYPSGVGDLSPGWIETRFIDQRVVKVTLDAGKLIVDAGTKPKVDAASPAPSQTAVTPPPVPEAAPPPPANTAAAPDAGRRRVPRRLGQ